MMIYKNSMCFLWQYDHKKIVYMHSFTR